MNTWDIQIDSGESMDNICVFQTYDITIRLFYILKTTF